MTTLTDEQMREHAAEIILDHARDVEYLSISEHLEDLDLGEGHDPATKAIDELIRTADLAVSWTVEQPSVYGAVIAERQLQDEKWGEQNHPDGTGPDVFWSYAEVARRAVLKVRNEAAILAATGDLTWLAILHEEVAEAFAEKDPAKLRAELIQVAAVAVAWVEAIDRRTARVAEVTA